MNPNFLCCCCDQGFQFAPCAEEFACISNPHKGERNPNHELQSLHLCPLQHDLLNRKDIPCVIANQVQVVYIGFQFLVICIGDTYSSSAQLSSGQWLECESPHIWPSYLTCSILFHHGPFSSLSWLSSHSSHSRF